MHGKNENFIMPDFINDYDLWDRYCGSVWQSILSELNFSRFGTVADIAPGASAKIEYALVNAGFCGKLYIIEPHIKTGHIILNKARKLLPEADIVLINKPFSKVFVNEKIDAVFANHPFDDFISAYLTKEKSELDVMFNDISQEEEAVIELLKKTWDVSRDRIENVKSQIALEFKQFLMRHMPSTVILNQYDSSYFDRNGLGMINLHANELFNKIKNISAGNFPSEIVQKFLDKNENYGNLHIGEVLLNAENWTVYEKK